MKNHLTSTAPILLIIQLIILLIILLIIIWVILLIILQIILLIINNSINNCTDNSADNTVDNSTDNSADNSTDNSTDNLYTKYFFRVVRLHSSSRFQYLNHTFTLSFRQKKISYNQQNIPLINPFLYFRTSGVCKPYFDFILSKSCCFLSWSIFLKALLAW